MSTSASPKRTLVNIGTHSLALYSHGPSPSTPNGPIVLFISGVSSSSLIWAGVTRLLPPSLRGYTYDRSGFPKSDPSPLPPTAENIALELSLLIEKAGITNPLILVAHSWACVLVNEFIALTGGKQIVGLVLVDANHETALQVLDPNNTNLNAIAEGVEPYSGRGLDVEHKLTTGEWEAFLAAEADEKFQLQAQKEDEEYVPSFATLQKKQLAKRQPLLGDKPVYVIGGSRKRDWSRLYEKGVQRGNGTEEQRRAVADLISTADEKSASLMREHLQLSTQGRLVFAKESGHFIQLTEPSLVVEGVTWVLDELQALS